MDDLHFSKKSQAKKPKKKEKVGLTRKEERKQENLSEFENHDRLIYEQIVERSYDWIEGFNKCEECGLRPAEHMHHISGGAHGRKTTLDNVKYICLECHNLSHGIKTNRL